MRVALFGAGGKVGTVLAAQLPASGHEVVDARAAGPASCDAAVDFTKPDAVVDDVRSALEAGVPVVIGTSGFDTDEVDRLARDAGVPCFFAPNFALGAVLMIRFAAEAARSFPRAEIVELHADTKRDAPSGTAAATARKGKHRRHAHHQSQILRHDEHSIVERESVHRSGHAQHSTSGCNQRNDGPTILAR